jgi:hypothetical protein
MEKRGVEEGDREKETAIEIDIYVREVTALSLWVYPVPGSKTDLGIDREDEMENGWIGILGWTLNR